MYWDRVHISVDYKTISLNMRGVPAHHLQHFVSIVIEHRADTLLR
jgi:hypothetical protein